MKALWWLPVLILCACPASVPSESTASVPDAGPDDGGISIVTPPDVGLEVVAVFGDGGTSGLAFDTTGVRPSVDAPDELSISTQATLQNYRLRLFDEADRVVPSNDEAQSAAEGLRYRMKFLAPLRTGFRYTLVLDAQTPPSLTDGTGHTLPDQRLEFQINGEKAKPVKPAKPGKSKRRRRG